MRSRFEGAEQQEGRRTARRALCGCLSDFVGAHIRIGVGFLGTYTEILTLSLAGGDATPISFFLK